MKKLFDLSLRQYAELSARKHPKITGGSVVLASAILGVSLLLLSAEVSKNKKSQRNRTQLKDLILDLQRIRLSLVEAAENDQKLFNRYRLLNRKINTRAEDLQEALKNATNSPLNACSLLRKALSIAFTSKMFCTKEVQADWEAGVHLIEAAFCALLKLAEANINSLEERDREYFNCRLKDEGGLPRP